MAIERMKKLRLLAVRDSKEELLKELTLHGCVEFSELESQLEGTEAAALVHPESSELSAVSPRPWRATTRASSASAPRRAGSAP